MPPNSAASYAALARAHGGVFTLAEAVRAGLTRHAVQWAGQTNMLHPVRRGVYTTAAMWQTAPPERRHRLEILGHLRVNPHLVACETSAAIALDLPTPSGPPARPQFLTARPPEKLQRGARGAAGNRGGKVTRRSRLSKAEIWTLKNGIRVTSAVRTVLDCARAWDPLWGLAVADAAIEQREVRPDQLVAAATARPQVRGYRQELWVAGHAREKVESPLESLPRGIVVLAGLPEPEPQVCVNTQQGQYRVDLFDAVNKVIIEADGKVKYASATDLWREKRREDALRDQGFEVVRFTMADYHHQQAWLASYRRALARGRSAPLGPAGSP